MIITKKIKLNEIKPAKYNPRQITPEMYEKLKQSIKEFGIVDPIIINLRTKTIIGGHQRYHVLYNLAKFNNRLDEPLHLIELGNIGWVFNTVDIDVKDKNAEKTLNIALNKINGEWDYQKLVTILEDLIDSDTDVELTGFTQTELNSFLSSEMDFDDIDTEFGNFDSLEIDDEFAPDQMTTVQDTVYVEKGDEWKFGNHAFKMGEPDPEQEVLIKITGRDIKISFQKIKDSGDDPIKEFRNINKDNKGLLTEAEQENRGGAEDD